MLLERQYHFFITLRGLAPSNWRELPPPSRVVHTLRRTHYFVHALVAKRGEAGWDGAGRGGEGREARADRSPRRRNAQQGRIRLAVRTNFCLLGIYPYTAIVALALAH